MFMCPLGLFEQNFQHVLFFELTIIVNCQVPLNFTIIVNSEHSFPGYFRKGKNKREIILLGLDLNRELPGAGRNG